MEVRLPSHGKAVSQPPPLVQYGRGLPRLPLEVLHKKYPPIKGKNGIYWSNYTIIGKNGTGG